MMRTSVVAIAHIDGRGDRVIRFKSVGDYLAARRMVPVVVGGVVITKLEHVKTEHRR